MASDISLNALKAAYYRAHDPTLTQQQIAEKAGLGTQAQVSRLLAEAREHKVLREVFQFPIDLPEDERQQVANSFFERHGELEDALAQRARELRSVRAEGGSPFKRLHVVAAPGAEHEKDEKVRERALRTFGIGAAEIVADYIDEATICCVAWGRTIAATVRHVRTKSGRYPGKTFIPIAGEPTNHEPNGVSPSDAARTLSLAWPGSESKSLRGVQARIPKSVYERDENNIARELIGYSEHYQEIYAATSKQPIESVGSDPWYLETEDAEGKDVLDLTVGNVGGVWVPRDDISPEEKLKVGEVNLRWLGAQEDHFRRCSLNADMQRHHPGVVVLAVEPAKAKIILEALYLVNVLIVSRQLAEALAVELLHPKA
jgi:DNA-binding transcriptional regulator LsrR (DeoR family)